MTTQGQPIFPHWQPANPHHIWQNRAACRNHPNPRLWFPKTSVSKTVRRICNVCPVQQECLEHALNVPEEHGVWGGLSTKQREKLPRQRGHPLPERPAA